ncbi:FtsX-like permease family protein [Crassaminicella profunda]|uniref:FtsX-like permease family protein n=1 Tax=Crassaminicella profunda TaxID=1286698 RepID=UPI001CA6A681|nr:FtsX-like permease family protein [Crassaminicella profunda]QZY55173.1 FtsX-like permease family protein [Crassaminicella profunda]
MYFKMAKNNIKKSFKDYTIYFMTLMLAVCIFYNFNAIESQTAMKEIYKIQELLKVLSYISVLIAIIFSGLMLYANNAVVKKRKKELGLYATLGMSKRKISQILMLETFMVGSMALLVGLVVGIILSQGISVLTGKLFAFDMEEYKFSLSMSAVYKTFIYFGIMFILVMIFNTLVVSKNKLIDMIYASKKNEEIKFKNTKIAVSLFLLGIILLGRGYYLGWTYTMGAISGKSLLAILLGSVGTLLFFAGLSGFLFTILKKRKRIYFKKLNIFVMKQFQHKINTNFIAMTIICCMLFVTIGMLSASFSVKYEVEKKIKEYMPFDAKITLTIDDNQKVQDMKEALKIVGVELEDFQYMVVDEYETEMKLESLLNEYANEILKERLKVYPLSLEVRKISQYNEMRKWVGEDSITLKENEITFLTNNDDMKAALKKLMKNKKEIKIDDKNYLIKNNIGTIQSNDELVAIVGDQAIKDMKKSSATMHIKVDEKNKEKLEEKIKALQGKLPERKYEYEGDVIVDKDKLVKSYGFYMYASTKMQTYHEMKGFVGTILYICIYLGFVFLIASAAVLAIQQLTEGSDSLNRYVSLKKIGATDEMIHKSIFIQVFVHFMLPLGLALVHAVVGLQIMNRLKRSSDFPIGVDLVPAIMVVIGIIIIYGGYAYVTYIGYKNIVKDY